MAVNNISDGPRGREISYKLSIAGKRGGLSLNGKPITETQYTKYVMENYFQKYIQSNPEPQLSPHAFLHKVTNEVVYQLGRLMGRGHEVKGPVDLNKILSSLMPGKTGTDGKKSIDFSLFKTSISKDSTESEKARLRQIALEVALGKKLPASRPASVPAATPAVKPTVRPSSGKPPATPPVVAPRPQAAPAPSAPPAPRPQPAPAVRPSPHTSVQPPAQTQPAVAPAVAPKPKPHTAQRPSASPTVAASPRNISELQSANNVSEMMKNNIPQGQHFSLRRVQNKNNYPILVFTFDSYQNAMDAFGRVITFNDLGKPEDEVGDKVITKADDMTGDGVFNIDDIRAQMKKGLTVEGKLYKVGAMHYTASQILTAYNKYLEAKRQGADVQFDPSEMAVIKQLIQYDVIALVNPKNPDQGYKLVGKDVSIVIAPPGAKPSQYKHELTHALFKQAKAADFRDKIKSIFYSLPKNEQEAIKTALGKIYSTVSEEVLLTEFAAYALEGSLQGLPYDEDGKKIITSDRAEAIRVEVAARANVLMPKFGLDIKSNEKALPGEFFFRH